MAKQRDKKMILGLVLNCTSGIKFIITSIILLCSLAALSIINPFPSCILAQSPPPSPASVKRTFIPYGSASYTFVLMSSYRGGPNTFAVIGLSSKPLHVFGNPSYTCLWSPHHSPTKPVSVPGRRILPDWGYGRVYTVVVVNCTFPVPALSGKLYLHASTGSQYDPTVEIEALVEPPETVNLSKFTSPPKYDYLYCGSSLYGTLSPQRVREWLAYHVRLFGEKSHFVMHDAGGVHEEVMEVLRPWMEAGHVTLQDIRDQEKFNGYYHNQFLIVNDCLHRYRFDAKWMFFFDIDEFIYVPENRTLGSVMGSVSIYTQFTIEQMRMSSQQCSWSDRGKTSRKWGIEKLVYRDMQKVSHRDRKYAIQPRNVYATGVHMSQDLAKDCKTSLRSNHLKYYHYHGTLAQRREPCRVFINGTHESRDKVPYVLDVSMRSMVSSVKAFELNKIGTRLGNTQQ